MNIIITGSSRGIGKAIALQMAREHHHVALCGRNAETLQQTVEEILAINPQLNVFSMRCDVSIQEEAIAFAQQCMAHFKQIDILINNAGFFLPGDLADEEEGRLDMMLRTNLMSAYHITRAVLPKMKANKSGTIINMGSVAGLKAYPQGGSYSISKFALIGFSQNLREELKPFNIKVSTINPGATMSDSWAGSGVAEDRIMEAQDIAKVVSSIINLSDRAVLEEVTLRPTLGDL